MISCDQRCKAIYEIRSQAIIEDYRIWRSQLTYHSWRKGFAKLNSKAFPFFSSASSGRFRMKQSDSIETSSRFQLWPKDLYLTHWSFRMSQPQQNWGQSLQYRPTLERIARREGQATFEEVIGAMDKLVTLVEKGVPSRELTHPIPAGPFWVDDFPFPSRNRWDMWSTRSLEDTEAPKEMGWLFSHKSQLIDWVKSG